MKKLDIPNFERNNYWPGKQLTAKDLGLEQSYFNRKRWLLNRTVSGWGVVCGLDVIRQDGADDGVTVTPGIAIDACGREIVVPEAQEVLLTRGEGQYPARSFLICLAFDECLTEPVPIGTERGCKQVGKHNRCCDSFRIWVEEKWIEEEGKLAPKAATRPVPPDPGREIECSLHDAVCNRLIAECPACPEDEVCLVLAEVTLPSRPGGGISIDPCSRRKLVYSNPLLYDLITTSQNYIGTWLVLGPVFDPVHQVGGHSGDQDNDHEHPWAEKIIMSIDKNELDPATLTNTVTPPRQGDQVVYRGMDQDGNKVFAERVYEWIKTQKFWCANFLARGAWAFMGGMSTAGSLTTWFRDQFAGADIEREASGGDNAYAILAKEAAGSSIGANGLIALPYFEGERTPLHDPAAKGVLFGLSLKHTRGDVYRAILEGVGFGIRHNVEAMRQEGVIPKRIMAVGGGTQNPLWMQLVADIADTELTIPAQQIGASYGDAFMAAVGVGVFKDLTEITRWVKNKKMVTPNLQAHQQYASSYKIFRDLYGATKSLMHELADTLKN